MGHDKYGNNNMIITTYKKGPVYEALIYKNRFFYLLGFIFPCWICYGLSIKSELEAIANAKKNYFLYREKIIKGKTFYWKSSYK